MINDFISAHRTDDIRQLALQAKRYPDIDMQFAIQQIDGWQRARHKLPMWAEHDDIIYPPHISMEQCSSEQTALYKQHLAQRLINKQPTVSEPYSSNNTPNTTVSEPYSSNNKAILYDLTGGFGVDFSYMSQVFNHATYIEQQEHLCDIARHNFNALNLHNTSILNTNAIALLPTLPNTNTNPNPNPVSGSMSAASPTTSPDDSSTTVIYLDPARRDTNGKKTYAISDCTPDVVTLLPTLKQKADIIIIKLSPMLDHHEAIRLLPGITEVHIISVNNECKEILLVINQKHINEQEKQTDSSNISSIIPPTLFCVNNDDIFITPVQSGYAAPSPTISTQSLNNSLPMGEGGGRGYNTLFIPNASIMKAGCFNALCHRFSLQALDNNSHLFISSERTINSASTNINDTTAHTDHFPGRTFEIISVSSMNKKELKHSLSGITKANITVRNFPLTADALRKKLSLKDGGNIYIFATTIAKNHILLICKKKGATP